MLPGWLTLGQDARAASVRLRTCPSSWFTVRGCWIVQSQPLELQTVRGSNDDVSSSATVGPPAAAATLEQGETVGSDRCTPEESVQIGKLLLGPLREELILAMSHNRMLLGPGSLLWSLQCGD